MTSRERKDAPKPTKITKILDRNYKNILFTFSQRTESRIKEELRNRGNHFLRKLEIIVKIRRVGSGSRKFPLPGLISRFFRGRVSFEKFPKISFSVQSRILHSDSHVPLGCKPVPVDRRNYIFAESRSIVDPSRNRELSGHG